MVNGEWWMVKVDWISISLRVDGVFRIGRTKSEYGTA
jgi:hypothetical protein